MWPDLPIVVIVDGYANVNIDHMISLLKRNDRVCKISIEGDESSLWEEVAAISEPFPALIELDLSSPPFEEDEDLALPESFLGGSVPRLRSLSLQGMAFPSIRKLLLSTRDLVALSLVYLSPSAYLSPESIVTILSTLTRLISLHLLYEIPHFWTHGASQRSPALTRVVIPALTHLEFRGHTEYLENIVSRIDAPLESIAVTFGELAFGIRHLRDFIGRTEILNAPHRADSFYSNYSASISVIQRKDGVDVRVLKAVILDGTSVSDLRLPCLAQAIGSLLSPLPSLERLGIYETGPWASQLPYEEEITHWMEVLRPFIAVKILVLDEPFVLSVASALQGFVGEQGILPALQDILLRVSQPWGAPIPEGITKFVASRKLSGRPVIVYQCHRKLRERRLWLN